MSHSSQLLLFPSLRGKKVSAEFSGGNLSSDSGVLLLEQIDRKLGLTKRLSECVEDTRQKSKVQQSVWDMARQRVYGIACGYEDCNDFDTLCADPLFKIATGRRPKTDGDLASQPTLARLENAVTVSDLVKMAEEIVAVFVARHQDKPPTQIILDLDATDDPTHGQQELEFYHAYYSCHCFLPLLVYATADEAEQELLAAVLRPGNRHAGHGSVRILGRILSKLRTAFPECRFVFRGDAGFALPELYTWCERKEVDYVISLAKNPQLRKLSGDIEKEAKELFEKAIEDQKAGEDQKAVVKVRHFGEIMYAAQTWPKARRVIVKAEMMSQGYNPRFVVTSLPAEHPLVSTPEGLYDFYTERGDVENRIKELKNDLLSGRTSCHRFLANQFRLLLHAAAFVLMQEMRRLMGVPSEAEHITEKEQEESTHWQAVTFRTKILKIAALVTETARRVTIKLAQSYPYQRHWKHLAVQLGVGFG